LRALGRSTGRQVFEQALERLSQDPVSQTRNLKTLRPNPVAQRELRVIGKYRVLFNVDEAAREIAILLVGEKRGDALIVQGERFTAHHEDRSTE
jgi:mRNA-degrading endonuclease RelE of RelBE toxin-antitoxin system